MAEASKLYYLNSILLKPNLQTKWLNVVIIILSYKNIFYISDELIYNAIN